MHPNKSFHWSDDAELKRYVAETVFAHIFIATPKGPMVAHAPVIFTAGGTVQFHLACGNRCVPHLDGAAALISLSGANCYQSADWYQNKDMVPTWLYESVEIEGGIRQLSDAELVMQVDALSAHMEATLLPKKPWTRDKMSAGKFDSMVEFIVGFELTVSSLRGTRKMNQNKSAADIEVMMAHLKAVKRDDIVALVESAILARES